MTTQVGLDASQFRLHIVRPTLLLLGLWSRPAEELVMGTAAAESQLRYVRQVGAGPALGLYQCEPATHADILANFLRFRAPLAATVSTLLCPGVGRLEQLQGNLPYATAICRIHYLRVPAPLPGESDVAGQAAYWLEHYNAGGKGTVAHYVSAYRALIGAAPTGV
jgi:hypothetical protein